MPGPSVQRRSDDGLEHACRELETTVTRVAKVVLHASALADRMDTMGTDPLTAGERRERVRLLRAAAEAGRRRIAQVELGAAPAVPRPR